MTEYLDELALVSATPEGNSLVEIDSGSRKDRRN